MRWDGQLHWKWGREGNIQGTFSTSLVCIANFSPGEAWRDAGYTGCQALHAVEDTLDFIIRLHPSEKFAQEAADAWSGDVLVLQHKAECASTPYRLADLLGGLQLARLTGHLRSKGAAVLAQAANQSNSTSQDSHVCSLNILLVAAECLHLWLPEHALDKKQLAQVIVQAMTHDSGICALLLKPGSKRRAPQSLVPSATQQQLQQASCCEQVTEYSKVLGSEQPAKGSLTHLLGKRARSESPEPGLWQPASKRSRTAKDEVASEAQLAEQQCEEVCQGHHCQQQQVKPCQELHLLQQQLQVQLQQPMSWQPQTAQPFEQQIINSILRSIKQLGLLYSDKHGMQELSQQHRSQLTTQPLLTQLRMLSLHATQYNPDRPAGELFHERFVSLEQSDKDTHWLNMRYGSLANRRLSYEAENLLTQFTARRLLPRGAVPEFAARALPADLQPAYVLCLGGYDGTTPLSGFAAHVLHTVAVKVLHALRQCPTATTQQQAAEESVQLAYRLRQQAAQADTDAASQDSAMHSNRSPTQSQVLGAASVPHTPELTVGLQTPTDPRLAAQSSSFQHSTGLSDMQAVSGMLQEVLVKLDRITGGALDERCLRRLQSESTLVQLLIWSKFCSKVTKDRQSSNASAFMTTLCRDQDLKDSHHSAFCSKSKRKGKLGHLGAACHGLLRDLQALSIIPDGDMGMSVRIAVAVLPPMHLQCVAMCYAAGIFMHNPGKEEEALVQLKATVAEMQQLLQQAKSAKTVV